MSQHDTEPSDESPTRTEHCAPSAALQDLPSLTPSKSATSATDSDPDGFMSDDDQGLLDALTLGTCAPAPAALRTPASSASMRALGAEQVSLSEPGPARGPRLGRKRSLSGLVALRFRGGKGAGEIGDEERGLLALDLDTYINSGDPDAPETRALPPSALFPTLTQLAPPASKQRPGATPPAGSLPLPPPRSEWPFGGTGPGKTSRGFIPGRTACLSTQRSEKDMSERCKTVSGAPHNVELDQNRIDCNQDSN